MILLVRVDNRLLHGQILEAWVPRLGVRRIVVADDAAAGSELARSAMTLCLPPELPAEVVPVARADFAALAASPEPTLVLLREVKDLARAVDGGGLTPALAPRVNVGNVHYSAGRRPVTPSVYLSAAEVQELEDLTGRGFAVEARAVPSDAPVEVAALRRNYGAAGGGPLV